MADNCVLPTMSGVSNFPSHDLASLEIVPSVPITIGITVTLDVLYVHSLNFECKILIYIHFLFLSTNDILVRWYSYVNLIVSTPVEKEIGWSHTQYGNF